MQLMHLLLICSRILTLGGTTLCYCYVLIIFIINVLKHVLFYALQQCYASTIYLFAAELGWSLYRACLNGSLI